MCDLSTIGLCTCRCHAWTVWPNKLHPSPAASAPLHVPSVCALPHPAAGQQPLPSYRRWCPVSNNLCFSMLSVVSSTWQWMFYGLRFLGTAGQNISDIVKYSSMDDHLEILESTLRLRHLAPTAPDTLGLDRLFSLFIYIYVKKKLDCCVIIEAIFWIILA